jgi:hypothetical protein
MHLSYLVPFIPLGVFLVFLACGFALAQYDGAENGE